ncbi:IPT/TIG domain-containing protein [Dokdonella sp.]|uniref:IPT/TIG domain-containing protein n=1 Tax=Dokdonella sp. TaxID=2291710 RepID=UPI001B0138D9|nr:IPT/TIG domain-containing protein [Dokdonella sp.]MBO9661464.1 IPT/TIG domain-containing protein [Dokdonella sp.]
MSSIRIAARRVARLILAAVLSLCALPLSAQVNTWSWQPASGYPGRWNELVVWSPPACCPNTYPNSATADARMLPYSPGFVGAADLAGGTYTVNRLRFTNINAAGGNFTLTGNGGTLQLRGTTPYIQTGTQGGVLARIVSTTLNLADHTRFDTTVGDEGLMVAAGSSIAMAAGATTVDKTGPGILVLAGGSSAGQFAVQAGTFVVEGSHSGGVSVGGGATLAGAGHVGGATSVAGGGVLHPGAYDIDWHGLGTGTLAFGSTLTMQSGSVFEITVNGTAVSQAAVAGNMSLGGAQLTVNSGTPPPAGTVLRIVDKQSAGAVTGTFAGLAEGAVFNSGGAGFKISYVGGTGNDVVLTALAAPAITSVSPGAGPAGGGQSVTITGTNLAGATSVTFGGTAATVTGNTATQIVATTPAHAVGAVTVAVTTPGGSGSKANAYTYLAAPTVASVAPTQGPAAGGTSIVITGANLSGATSVTFGGTAATAFTVNSATQITATAPAHAAGAVAVAVATPGGSGSKANAYTYLAAPTVTSVVPAQGPAAGGTTVTITGTNLAGATSVTFGGAAATITGNTATQVVATAPAHAAGAVTVAVTTPGGSGSKANAYTYVAMPTIASAAPAQGPAAGGTAVTITGTNLAGATSVTFGGAAATITGNTATGITATAPSHAAGAVAVAVTTAGGTGSAANAYTYVAVPTVTSVVPNRGSVLGGTSVTIGGSDLAGAIAVSFGGTPATSFVVNDATRITAVAPAHAAGTVDVVVTTPGGASAPTVADRYTYVDPRRCHVRREASGANDGSSWADAYTDLQPALADAGCAEIWVARGIYRPVVPADPDHVTAAERAATFRVPPRTALYGGFAGSEDTLDARDPAAHPTVLSGDLAGDDSGAVDGVDPDVPTDASVGDNSLHVLAIDGTDLAVDATTVLDGFIVTAGHADGAAADGKGGGLACDGRGAGKACNPALRNLVFSGNFAALGGGALHADGGAGGEASPTIGTALFRGNRAGQGGGALFENEAGRSSPALERITFAGNVALAGGGAMHVRVAGGGTGAPRLTNVTFSGNRAGDGAGSGRGGAILVEAASAGALHPSLTNITFSDNHADLDGGAVQAVATDAVNAPALRNVILWGDSAGGAGAEIASDGAALTLDHAVVEGGCPTGVACGGAILAADPVLGPLADNGGDTPTHLPRAGSSAVDAGDDATCAPDDQRGVTRPQGPHCDLGAVEAGLPSLALTLDDGGREYVGYGEVVDYVVQLVNDGEGTARNLAVDATFGGGADVGNAQWQCIAGSIGASCIPVGNGPIHDAVTIPPGVSMTWLIHVPVAPDTLAGALDFEFSAEGLSPVTGHATIVLFRDGFDGAGQ